MRYLQYFPDQADGVILDGVLPLDHQVQVTPSHVDGNLNDMGLALLARCDLDAACSLRMGEPAANALQRAIESAATGSCAKFATNSVTKANIQDAMVGLLGNQGAAAIPAIVYRLARCDQSAISFVKALIESESSEGEIGKEDASEGQIAGPEYNNVLALNVQLLEMSKDENTGKIKPANSITDLFFSGESDTSGEDDSSAGNNPTAEWPNYPLPESPEPTLPQSPVLLLNGNLDTSTTANYARIVEYAWAGASLFSQWFPNSGHGAYSFSECANQVVLSFMVTPMSGPYTSCITLTPELDFIGATLEETEYSGLLTGPLWGSDF